MNSPVPDSCIPDSGMSSFWDPQLDETTRNFISPFSKEGQSTLNHSITFAPLTREDEEELSRDGSLTFAQSIPFIIPDFHSLNNADLGNLFYSFYCNPPTSYPKFDNPKNSKHEAAPKGFKLSREISASVTVHPAEFQIANYNIYPPPALQLDAPLAFNQTVYISLVEAQSMAIIPAGFQSGDVRMLRPGTHQIQFTGLKLSKKKVINGEVRQRKFNHYDCSFKIRFSIDDQQWFTSPFKLVSSYSQLPNEVRDYVRPSKLSKRTSPTPEFSYSRNPRTEGEQFVTSSSSSDGSPNLNFLF